MKQVSTLVSGAACTDTCMHECVYVHTCVLACMHGYVFRLYE